MYPYQRGQQIFDLKNANRIDRSETQQTDQLSNLNRARQWRQAYSQSTTCVSYQNSEEVQSPVEACNPDFSATEQYRSPRLLPSQPNRKSSINLNRESNNTRGYCQSEHSSSDCLRPPQLGHVHRASSFDGRVRNTAYSDTYCNPVNTQPHRISSSQFNTGSLNSPTSLSPKQNFISKRTNPSIARSDLTGRRERLVIAPSIEISLAGDYSSSSDNESEVSTPNSFIKSEDELRTRRISACQETLPGSCSDNQMSGSRAFPRALPQIAPQGRSTPEHAHAPRNLNRPKLTRQPRSFQGEPITNRLHNIDQKGSVALMDEFDYFCQIANSPSGSREPIKGKASASLRPSRQHLAAMRSHSMRNASPETPHSENEVPDVSAFSLGQKEGDTVNPAYLRPPARGQLRRASTEEERFKRYPKDRLPVSATLSYSPVNASVQNICRSPPKFVPQLPVFSTPPIPNPSLPIGIPITEDSLFADKPGMTFYQVQVLGAIGVGKTSLCRQLSRLTSGKSEMCELDDEENRPASHSVTAALRGSVYTVNFIDTSAESFEENLEIQIHDCVDAFIVMYAIDDSSSYEAARLIMNALSPAMDLGYSPSTSPKCVSNQLVTPAFIYLVANKTDLVRGRQVSTEDGRHLASVHDAKFIEVSASLNHLVADLFVLLVAHLRETEQRGRDPRLPTERRSGYYQSAGSAGSHSAFAKTSGQGSNTFRIPSSTKSSLTRFFKKHFTKTSEENE